jgi:hypothetical protein
MHISTYYDNYLTLEGKEFTVECALYSYTISVSVPKGKLKNIHCFYGIKNDSGKIYKLNLSCDDNNYVENIYDDDNYDYETIVFDLDKDNKIFDEFRSLIKENSIGTQFILLISKFEEVD